ncbi:MAG: shikimate dehydrogenase [Ruminococcus sp.]|nr:shikimate dehydrogenase [Ruminococcus sp.]
MDYGLIGEKLPHSFSKEIHESIGNYEYSLKELNPDELKDFILQKNYKAINVTIPYKEAVIPFLDEIDGSAEAIGAVNTIVNCDGRLYGYNTDFLGMKALIERVGVVLKYKKALILGTGGTSKTAYAVCERLGAKEIRKVSRTGKDGSLTYEEAYENYADADVIINTTPCGMYPNIFDCPIDLSHFTNLSGVIDAVYNPLCTSLVLNGMKQGVSSEGGLYMLVAQAVYASALFTDTELDAVKITNEIYDKIYFSKRNIVLTGMPTSGKSTVGKLIAKELDRPFIDTDALIVEKYGDIPTIFKEHGESYFRDLETEVIRSVADRTGAVISTGGGAILREENIDALRRNGAIYFIDRSLEHLSASPDRPLADKIDKLKKLYEKRINKYIFTADFIIDGDCDPEDVADSVINGD